MFGGPGRVSSPALLTVGKDSHPGVLVATQVSGELRGRGMVLLPPGLPSASRSSEPAPWSPVA